MLGLVLGITICAAAPIRATVFDPPAQKYSGVAALLSEVAEQRAEIEVLRKEVHDLWEQLQDHLADVEQDRDYIGDQEDKLLIRRVPPRH